MAAFVRLTGLIETYLHPHGGVAKIPSMRNTPALR